MQLTKMRVHSLYARLVIVLAAAMLIVAAVVGWKAKDSAPPIGPADLVALLPDKYLDLASCQSRGWSGQIVNSPDNSSFYLCMPRGASTPELDEALKEGNDRYVQRYAIKTGALFWAAFMALIIGGLIASDWVARSAGKGFLLYEADTSLFSKAFMRSAAVIVVALVTMSVILSVGRVKQIMYASAEYPQVGFTIAWVVLELLGKRVRFAAALAASWTLLLLGTLLTWPAMNVVGKDMLGLVYVLPAAGLISLMQTLLPYQAYAPTYSRRSRGIRAGLAFLLSLCVGMLIIIPAEISDQLRSLWSS